MLVGVARLIGLSEPMLTHLPRGWKHPLPPRPLEHDLLDRLVREGEVHPELTLAEAEAFGSHQGKPRPSGPNVRIKAHVRSWLPSWIPLGRMVHRPAQIRRLQTPRCSSTARLQARN